MFKNPLVIHYDSDIAKVAPSTSVQSPTVTPMLVVDELVSQGQAKVETVLRSLVELDRTRPSRAPANGNAGTIAKTSQ